ncbi:metalloregulator ArsR/SmtB family transcription factor [Cocleimonas sp. KMM 6892]|uniref:ArsR/SmtB family transcription factor n=1 Tax=unclassified Cocleimonas TaxID=2639732 RepID=UPI002DBFB924|nr:MULTISPECIES: metalloregulator ArsR/SmtB family transcription factor [unclassified Cocleimonas]MEB8431096.1 metalloregulator ArsR/SmtB family transcription factor [Cocleimonas sp. KMM 6892]MEC4714132.1 metalloregulator ArsR/SmtB family transcription factor [Cocleimonas sp. KMM 6895]MEC4743463.1 metalloregulator ArsR/SmtB family transcription factor [Cocleimonas sp. KMM 6896]
MSNYSNDIHKRAEMFKALGNPHRLAIFQRLSTCCVPGTICSVEDAIRFTVGELGEDLEIAPSTVSHHLKELLRAGLIQSRRNGKNIECWIEPQLLDQLSDFFKVNSDIQQMT